MFVKVKQKIITFIVILFLKLVFSNGYKYRTYNSTKVETTGKHCQTSDDLPGECLPYAQCFHQYDSLTLLERNTCIRRQATDSVGVCCPIFGTFREPVIKNIPIKRPKYMKRSNSKVNIDKSLLKFAINEARDVIERQLSNERDFIRAGHIQRDNTMESFHQGFFGSFDPRRNQIARDGTFILETSRVVARELDLKPEICREILHKYCLKNTTLSRKCFNETKCDSYYKYRSIDGTCNNLEHPNWGRALTQLSRLMPAQYSDGIDEFRESVEGEPLPGARELSSYLTLTGDSDHPHLSVLFMQFGQFIDHDLSLGIQTRADTGQALACCGRTPDGDLARHPACKPIPVPPDDPFYSRFNITCNNFVRAIPAPTGSCSLGPREQASAVTHFMDASHIYGSDFEKMKAVRSFRDGKLRVSIINGREFLPYDVNGLSVICTAPEGERCIYAGDIRVNQQLGLIVLHLMFFREHNRIATELKRLQPGWSDEILFQETRRIVVAELQWITYNEFLPLALGRRVMKDFGLYPSPWGFVSTYNPKTNPSILNAFAGAGFRWHTLVQNTYNLLNSDGEITSTIWMKAIFNDPTEMYRPGAVDEVLYGTVVQPTQSFDPTFVDTIKNHLFPTPGSKFGADLVAINIQRGRDHGLPSYNAFRKICGLPVINDFEDLNEYFREGIAERFERIYRNVDDIDLFLGGTYEKPLKGALVGPTFACIVAEQFRRTKFGDRFWFENFGFRHSFTLAQIREITKVSLSGIICANGDDIKFYPPLALVQNINGNRLMDCSNMPKINFKHWKGENVFNFPFY